MNREAFVNMQRARKKALPTNLKKKVDTEIKRIKDREGIEVVSWERVKEIMDKAEAGRL